MHDFLCNAVWTDSRLTSMRILHRDSLRRGFLKSNTNGSSSTLCLSDAMGLEGSGFSAWNACFSYATWFNSDSQYWHQCRHCTVIHSALGFSQAMSTVLEPLCLSNATSVCVQGSGFSSWNCMLFLSNVVWGSDLQFFDINVNIATQFIVSWISMALETRLNT